MPRSLSMPQLICCHGVANFDGTYLEEFQKFCQGVSEVVCHSHALGDSRRFWVLPCPSARPSWPVRVFSVQTKKTKRGASGATGATVCGCRRGRRGEAHGWPRRNFPLSGAISWRFTVSFLSNKNEYFSICRDFLNADVKWTKLIIFFIIVFRGRWLPWAFTAAMKVRALAFFACYLLFGRRFGHRKQRRWLRSYSSYKQEGKMKAGVLYRINLHYTAVAWPCFTVFLWHEEKVNDLHLNTVSRYLDPDLDLWSIATPHGLVGPRSNSMIFSKLPLSKSLWNVWRVSSHLSLLVVVWNLTWRRETKSPVAFELLVDILMHLLIFIGILLWDPQTLETHEAWNSNLTVPSLSGML